MLQQIETRTFRAHALVSKALAKGIKIERAGKCWHICGPGVDILVADLDALAPSDLRPFRDEHEPA